MSDTKKKKSTFRRLALTICIFVSGLVVSLAGLYKSRDTYAYYDEKMHDRPPVDLVMAGVSDGVYPWSEGREDMLEYAENDLLTADTDAVSDGAHGDENKEGTSVENSDVTGKDKDTDDAVKSSDKEGVSTGDSAGTVSSDSLAGDESAAKSSQDGITDEETARDDKDESGGIKDGENGSEEKSESNNDDEKSGQEDEQESTASDDASDDMEYMAAGSNVFKTDSDEIPPQSMCPVCDAVDYGIANTRYMSPEGWSPEKDTEGMFAVNGLYRELQTVDEDYFADALYIGDSRVEGIRDYSGLEDQASFAYKNSLTIYKLFDEGLKFTDPYGTRTEMTLDQVLSIRYYGKIYIQIGINEIGVGNTKTFYEEYRNVLGRIRAQQPLAILYIDGIMHVTAAKSCSDSVFTNSNIVDKNRAIATLANGRDIFYIDVNPYVCDENGNLLPELTIDHAHLKAAAHERTREFLLTHAALP